jgi:formylglycine-generating enzyme required for sulfatase activity/serine/threonine protein kinase
VPGGDALNLVGKMVSDKYAVEAVVGEGGFATVYRATHVIWKRPVALKVFKAFVDVPEKDRQKLLEEFVQEGALLADLSARSAAIVQARDIGMLEVAGRGSVPFMVLEWLDGATLEQVLAEEQARGIPRRTLAEIVRLLDPVAEALALAHKKGIAHRDVKPANVFVSGDPRGEASIKLLDFGIAKVVSDAQKMAGTFTKTSGQVTSFTPAYGAPEQFTRTHGATGPWTDVFALALIVVELMTGQEALRGEDFVQLAVAAADPQRRPTPRALGAVVTDEVEAALSRALAVRPADRWPTVWDFWNALRQAVRMAPMPATTEARPRTPPSAALAGALTVAAEPPPGAAVAAAERDGRRRRAGIVLVVGALVVSAAALALHRGSRFDPARTSDRSAPGAGPAEPAVVGTPPVAGPAPGAPSASAPPSCPDGMVSIPGGSFFMGSDDDLPIEKPAHQVTLAPYCIDRYEVTVEAYKACSDAGRCKRAGTTDEWDGIKDSERKVFDPLCNVRDPLGRARHPINCVDWEMADKFCRERGGRLPTEAEWEFAARGPDGRKFPWGDEEPAAGHLNACGKECVAWGRAAGVEEKAMYAADDGFPNTAPVGSFPRGASRYGVEDVVGNVWEWVADWYAEYGKGEQQDPRGPAAGEERVIRGGAWNASYPAWVRPTFRYKDAPTKRSYGIGFRCAR